jgi:hypothetical protein
VFIGGNGVDIKRQGRKRHGRGIARAKILGAAKRMASPALGVSALGRRRVDDERSKFRFPDG